LLIEACLATIEGVQSDPINKALQAMLTSFEPVTAAI
jgi:hypothetical protein